MEIYDFINSKDIKTHWKNINYVPTAVESAWLIWQSKDHTLEEKHAVWQNILDNSEDCLIPKGRFNLLPRWLHPFLREYMKIENYLIKEFLEKNRMRCIFTASVLRMMSARIGMMNLYFFAPLEKHVLTPKASVILHPRAL